MKKQKAFRFKSPTSEQVKAKLDEHKLSQPRAAYIACVAHATFQRYCLGTSTMHPLVWKQFLILIEDI